jgi:hypothetical protein
MDGECGVLNRCTTGVGYADTGCHSNSQSSCNSAGAAYSCAEHAVSNNFVTQTNSDSSIQQYPKQTTCSILDSSFIMKNIFKQLGSFKKLFAYGNHIRPTRDWLLVLGSAGVLFFVGIAWHLWIFSSLVNGKTLGVPPASVAPATESSTAGVQTIFQKRATESNHYQNDYHFVDPSAPGA